MRMSLNFKFLWIRLLRNLLKYFRALTIWKILAILFALLNLKSLPGSWHVSLSASFIRPPRKKNRAPNNPERLITKYARSASSPHSSDTSSSPPTPLVFSPPPPSSGPWSWPHTPLCSNATTTFTNRIARISSTSTKLECTYVRGCWRAVWGRRLKSWGSAWASCWAVSAAISSGRLSRISVLRSGVEFSAGTGSGCIP